MFIVELHGRVENVSHVAAPFPAAAPVSCAPAVCSQSAVLEERFPGNTGAPPACRSPPLLLHDESYGDASPPWLSLQCRSPLLPQRRGEVRVDTSESGSTWRLGRLVAACFDDV